MNHFFTSDTHFAHKNIVKGVSDWEDKSRCRDFETLEEHNEVLIQRINSKVKENDTLYHLGDWSFGSKGNIFEFRQRLLCKNVHIFLGNHDDHIVDNMDGCRALFSSVQHYGELKIGKDRIIMCHYAMRVWNKSHKGSWMLYGHSHGSLDQMQPETTCPTWIGDQYFVKNYKTMDVGVDTNNLYPYHLDELRSIMEKKEILLNIDHHDGSRH